ncbi:MAG: NAD(+) diphosphatase, partial [Spirochaetales bacterium]|nr:NAD(+) diphosphatase [Spirochaetales bacterium]
FAADERFIAVDSQGSPFLKPFSAADEAENLVIGSLDGIKCRCVSLEEGSALPEGLRWEEFRDIYRDLDEEDQFPVGRARVLLEWRRTHRFCGACGAEIELSETEHAGRCPGCGELRYPVIAPAVIIRITRGDEILLAHNARFPEGFFSHVAGFVDAGENLEQAVRREVMEEVQLEVENIRYFGSQSWPMPHSLMLAFTAECPDHDAQPVPDGEEIDEARWFTRETMPEIPNTGSIAGRMLADYLQNR